MQDLTKSVEAIVSENHQLKANESERDRREASQRAVLAEQRHIISGLISIIVTQQSALAVARAHNRIGQFAEEDIKSELAKVKEAEPIIARAKELGSGKASLRAMPSEDERTVRSLASRFGWVKGESAPGILSNGKAA